MTEEGARTEPADSDHKRIQESFREILNRDLDAVIDSCRGKGGKIVLNADDLFKLCPEYAADHAARRWLGAVLYETAKKFINRAFTRLLQASERENSHVIFTAGGGASGKSSLLRAQADRGEVDFILDTTLSDPERAIGQIQEALGAGRKVEINYIYRDFQAAVRAMVRRGLDPNNGRIVPIDSMAKTHFGAQDSVFTLLERYENEPRVVIRLWEMHSSSSLRRILAKSLVEHTLPPVDELRQFGQSILDEIFAEADRDPSGQWKGLSGNGAFYEAARSRAQRSIRP